MSIIPKRHYRVILSMIYITIATLILYFIIPKIISWFLPFIFAYIIAFMIEPLVRLCNYRLKIPRKLASAILIILALGVIGFILFLIGSKIAGEIETLYDQYPIIRANAIEYINYFINSIGWLPVEVKNTISDFYNNISSYLWTLIQSSSEGSINMATNFLSGIPQAMIAVLVFLISSFFISSDRVRINQAIKKAAPKKVSEAFLKLKQTLFFALGAYLKAQATLMSITFVHLYIWFLILDVKYTLLLAFVIALFDAIPFLGIGGILIPWAIVSFFMGNYTVGICLLIIYGLNTVMRQFLEPKLVSVQIGMHPLMTIMSIYVGLKLYGVIGVILGPTVLIVITDLFKSGVFKRLISYDKEDLIGK